MVKKVDNKNLNLRLDLTPTQRYKADEILSVHELRSPYKKSIKFIQNGNEYRINSMDDLIGIGNDNLLGNGHSGNVFALKHVESGHEFAVKSIDKQHFDNIERANFNELDISNYDLSTCSSLINFYGYLYENGCFYLFYELMDIDLNQLIKKVCLTEALLSKVAKCILDSIRYLALKHIIHQDIKPSNVVINRHGQIKLIDFGECALLNKNNHCEDLKGDSFYMSPEKMRFPLDAFTIKSEVWSLGMTLMELALRKYPFSKQDPFAITNAIELNRIPRLKTSEFSHEMCSFVDMCLDTDPNKRASVDELLKHTFITKYEHEELDLHYLNSIIIR